MIALRHQTGKLVSKQSNMSSADETNDGVEKKIKFKKRPLRTRRKSSSDESDKEEEEEEVDISKKLCDMKALQKLRNRPNGVSIVGLNLGIKTSVEDEDSSRDPFKTKSGGMINMKNLKSGKMKPVDDAYDTGIGTQFSAETNKRDEDEEMMKYIEEQLSKKKGHKRIKKEGEKNEESELLEPQKYYSPEEAALLAVPDSLRTSSTQKSEEMLSNQMLSGIPEVDLGIDAKIRNIEATEEAKLRLIWNRHNKNDGPSQFVPSNITVNFMQQNKINVDETEVGKGQWKTKDSPGVQKRRDELLKKKEGEKATDDYHYERFKKQFRRY